MNKSLALLAATILLAACGQQPANQSEATPAKATDSMAGMNNMAVPADGNLAKGSGTVIAIDSTTGTITLDHGPIPEAGWPAMTMAFNAPPQVLDSVKVGDKVAFELALKDGAGEVTAIRKQ